MPDEARKLLRDRNWWRRVEDETHLELTGAAHEISDETARALQYLALLCGALTHDAGWGEDEVTALAATIRRRVGYNLNSITNHVALLLLTGHRAHTGNDRK